jgi:hypothetical protein
MIEVRGDLWGYVDQLGVQILITTNGHVRSDGHGVMGRGCAREALERWPELGLVLGRSIRTFGNTVQLLSDQHRIWSFPVKHHWSEPANLSLIAKSVASLNALARASQNEHENWKWVLPRPGCGNGRLSWEVVEPIVSVLPDNVLVISK